MKAVFLIVFALVATAQWYVPISMIRESELILTEGEELKFRTRPVDPSDPFRGKFVTLSFANESIVMDTLPRYSYGEEVYAGLALDDNGFAVIDTLYENNPGSNVQSVKVKIIDAYDDFGKQAIRVQFPFDRFYVEESKASEAEKVYWESLLPTLPERQTYAVVRVRKGRGVLIDVRIADRSIND